MVIFNVCSLLKKERFYCEKFQIFEFLLHFKLKKYLHGFIIEINCAEGDFAVLSSVGKEDKVITKKPNVRSMPITISTNLLFKK